MANSGSVGVITNLESFQVDNINTSVADGVKWLVLGDGGDTVFARAGTAGRGLHAAGALAATDDNLVELCGDTTHVFGQDGVNGIEVLFQISVATDIAFNIGFNDDSLDASNTLPAELATATWTTNAATFVGLAFDVDATNDDVHCMWVDDDNDSTEALADLRMAGATLTAAKWAMARVEIQDRGSGKGVRATFTWAQDGKSFEKVFDTSVDRDAALCYYLGFENRAATAHSVYIKYIKTWQSIAD